MKRLLGTAAVAAAALVLSCDSGPRAGELVLELTSPTEQLGALVFHFIAAEPSTIDTLTAACGGCQLFTVRRSATEMRGVITGQIGAGPLVRVAVSDVKTPDAYSGVITEAAAPDFRLVSVSGMRLAIPQQ